MTRRDSARSRAQALPIAARSRSRGPSRPEQNCCRFCLLSCNDDSTKAARLTPHRTPPSSIFVSGLRSEHTNPSRSTLAGSGLNRPSVAPEIQSAPGSGLKKPSLSRWTRVKPPSGPGDTLRRRGVDADFGIRRRDRAHPAASSVCDSFVGQEDRWALRPSVHFAARAYGASRSCETRFRLLWCCRPTITNFSPCVLLESHCCVLEVLHASPLDDRCVFCSDPSTAMVR